MCSSTPLPCLRSKWNIFCSIFCWIPRSLLSCLVVRFQLPLHQNSDDDTRTCNNRNLSLTNAVWHLNKSAHFQKARQALDILFRSSFSKPLLKVTIVPKTLKPSCLGLRCMQSLPSFTSQLYLSSGPVVHQTASCKGTFQPNSVKISSQAAVIFVSSLALVDTIQKLSAKRRRSTNEPSQSLYPHPFSWDSD